MVLDDLNKVVLVETDVIIKEYGDSRAGLFP